MADAVPGSGQALSVFQVDVARLFFDLPTSAGFLLAGGAALAAQRLTVRPTRDLDLFSPPDRGGVTDARDAFEAAARARGWTVERVRDSPSFCRLVVSGPESVLVDLAVDSPPALPPVGSIAGPTFAPEELAGRKLIALFDRAEARDFADVYMLARRFSRDVLLARAAELDGGFDRRMLAGMMRMHTRFTDRDFPVEPGQVPGIRDYFDNWADDLTR
jgi:hypothetical protein